MITDSNILSLDEIANPAYQRNNGKGASNLKAIWAAIDRKQAQLQMEVFGELNDKLLDITKEKAKVMGQDKVAIPHNICNAGNDKLPANVLVINMSSSLMCPSFYFGICTITNGACYAQRAENQYPETRMQRQQTDIMHTQLLQMYQKGNKKPMQDYFRLIEHYIQLGNAYADNVYKDRVAELEHDARVYNVPVEANEINRARRIADQYKIQHIRLNETGDFQCQLAVDLWAQFADKIKQKYQIQTHAYTARNLNFEKAGKLMSINYSHESKHMNENRRKFQAIDADLWESLRGGDKVNKKTHQPEPLGQKGDVFFYKCPCERGATHCDECQVCFHPNLTEHPYTIFVKYHGILAANGLKNLFTQSEVSRVVEKLKEHGWLTDEEYDIYASKHNQDRLADMSNKIQNQRQAPPRPRGKAAKEKS